MHSQLHIHFYFQRGCQVLFHRTYPKWPYQNEICMEYSQNQTVYSFRHLWKTWHDVFHAWTIWYDFFIYKFARFIIIILSWEQTFHGLFFSKWHPSHFLFFANCRIWLRLTVALDNTNHISIKLFRWVNAKIIYMHLELFHMHGSVCENNFLNSIKTMRQVKGFHFCK